MLIANTTLAIMNRERFVCTPFTSLYALTSTKGSKVNLKIVSINISISIIITQNKPFETVQMWTKASLKIHLNPHSSQNIKIYKINKSETGELQKQNTRNWFIHPKCAYSSRSLD